MKCPGAETLLRAVINEDEGVQSWLDGQDISYLNELIYSCAVLGTMAIRAREDQQVAS